MNLILITKHEIKVQNYSGKLFNCTSGRRDFKGGTNYLTNEIRTKLCFHKKTKKRRGFFMYF